MNKIPSLDGVRAVAVLAVVLGHAEFLPISPSSLGVTIFFFLSGYLITTLLRLEHEGHGRISLRDFYLRRAIRIFPSMYLVLVVAVLLHATTSLAEHSLSASGVVGTGLFGANYMQVFGGENALPLGTGIYWSLAVEEHFYLLFPLLYIGLWKVSTRRRDHAAVLASLCGAILVWRLILVFGVGHSNAMDWAYYATDARADSILFGCLLAVAANPFLDRAGGRPVAVWVLPAGLAMIVGGALLPEKLNHTIGFSMIGLALMLVFTAIVACPTTIVGRILNWKPIAYLGVLSYGMYLVHRLIQISIDEYVPAARPVTIVLGVVGTIAAAYMLRVGVERPFAGLRRRLAHTAAQAVGVGASTR